MSRSLVLPLLVLLGACSAPMAIGTSTPVPTMADRDGDGIADEVDACPDVAGAPSDDPKKNGCPADRDLDGIPDAQDACPDEPGPANPDPKKNGCPVWRLAEAAPAPVPPPKASSPKVEPTPAPARVSAPAPVAPVVQPAVRLRLVAVLEFKSALEGKDRKDVDVAYLSESVRRASLRPGLRVMTRENELVLLEATGRKLSDCEGECEVDTGRRLGADVVITGRLLRFGTQLKLELSLHDTHSGELMAGSLASGRNADELDARLAAAVSSLLAPLR